MTEEQSSTILSLRTPMSSPSRYTDIDWLELWRKERDSRSWQSKTAVDWDRKAASFAERNDDSPYIPLFLARLPLEKDDTVLDVGCGPGTLAIPLAGMVRQVVALDYSAGMIEVLRGRAEKLALENITALQCAWEDDWAKAGVRPADIAIASRSMNIDDLPSAIKKLDAYAGKYVFITDRIAPSPFDPDAFAAIGRDFDSGPDYIFTLNMLYNLGIHAHVEILRLEGENRFASRREAVASYSWMFKDLDEKEDRLLQEYVDSLILTSDDGGIVLRRPYPPTWAMIWWEK